MNESKMLIFNSACDKIIKNQLQVNRMNNTFYEGVDPDGLKNIEDIKCMIYYLIKSVNEPLTKKLINDILQEDYSLANYFEVNQAISESVKAGTVKIKYVDGEEYLHLTDEAKKNVSYYENNLPRTVREKAINCAVRLLTRLKREKENDIYIEKLEKGYNVTFTLYDVDTQFMKLTIYVSDLLQVEAVKENFLSDPTKLYSGIISSLTV